MTNSFETVIGLEIHIQLNTACKAFASDKNEFSNIQNKHISAITLGLPGTLPKANIAHVEKGIKLCLALGSDINHKTLFDRKNYFYPDLPKGYQITQDKCPIGVGGAFNFISEDSLKTIRIHHMHMEEDAGKTSHDLHEHYSLLDYNRAGTPLIELVTEPDFRSGQEVHDFLAAIQQLVQYLDISDGNMEEGSIRCDCNVSVRPIGQLTYGERCEIKNVNSKKFARQAIIYESQRQINCLVNGESITKTTMLFDPNEGVTRPMRKKETENDYRYFPEPDLCPIIISKDKIESIKRELGWLPWELIDKLTSLNVSLDDTNKLCEKKAHALYFLELCKQDHGSSPKEIASIIVNKLIPEVELSGNSIDQIIHEQTLFQFIALYENDKINKSMAWSKLWPELIYKGHIDAEKLANQYNLIMADDQDFLDPIIQDVISSFPDKVKDYRSGKKGLIGFFMGQVKLKAGNNVNPQTLKDKVEKILS
ncbi:MAG: hypothetical protein RLZZ546_364 [Bacteroidota bacterium]